METKLNNNEVMEIAKMQSKIDSYEAFILALSFMIENKKDVVSTLFEETELEGQMNLIWKFVKAHK